MFRPILIAALLALAACGRHASTEPGGVSAKDAGMLNNAAAMLDTAPDNLTAPENGAADDSGPAANAD